MSNKMHYITRQDKGWIVRMDQGKPTETFQRFADQQYAGDQEKSLAAAIIYRDQHLINRSSNPSIHHRSGKNTSGFIGISREKKEEDHYVYTGWRAIFHVNHKQRQRSFSSQRYGECEAFRKACEMRYRHAGELRQVIEDPDIPCAPTVPVIYDFEQTKKS